MGVLNVTGIAGNTPPYAIEIWDVANSNAPIFLGIANTNNYTTNFTHIDTHSYYVIVKKTNCSEYQSNNTLLDCTTVPCNFNINANGSFIVQNALTYLNNTGTNITIDIGFSVVNVPDRLLIYINNNLIKDTGCIGSNSLCTISNVPCINSSLDKGYTITLNNNDVLSLKVDGTCSTRKGTVWSLGVKCNNNQQPIITNYGLISDFESITNNIIPNTCNLSINTSFTTLTCIPNYSIGGQPFPAIRLKTSYIGKTAGVLPEFGVVIENTQTNTQPSFWDFLSVIQSGNYGGSITVFPMEQDGVYIPLLGQTGLTIWVRDKFNHNCISSQHFNFPTCP